MSIHLGLLKVFHELDIFQSPEATGIALESLRYSNRRRQVAVQSKRSLSIVGQFQSSNVGEQLDEAVDIEGAEEVAKPKRGTVNRRWAVVINEQKLNHQPLAD